MSRERVVVGISGGVDSSVAAYLLKQQGHDVVGVFMKNWEDDDTDEYCTSRADLVDAASVCDVVGIELEAVNFAREYRERVFAHFLADYRAGRTPNPDVLCNSEIKFAAFLEHARKLGATRIATGHYARTRMRDARVELVAAADRAKDQTYFLHRLTQAQLAPALFPLGDMQKRDVRALAKRVGIPTWAKKDSTGICFIGERPFRDFLARYLPRDPGPMVTPDGAIVGEHAGLAYYTLGQRQQRRRVVRGRQGPRAQSPRRRAGACASAAPSPRRGDTGCALDRRRAAAFAGASCRQDALSDARRRLYGRARRRHAARALRRAAVGADARAISRALRGRRLPRRRRHRRSRRGTCGARRCLKRWRWCSISLHAARLPCRAKAASSGADAGIRAQENP
jgi:diphthamide synthase (EF-2-diphthine--ammonia ligase)